MEKKATPTTAPSRRVFDNEIEQIRREHAKRAYKMIRKEKKSLRQAAKVLGVSHETVRGWLRKYYEEETTNSDKIT